MRKRRLAGELTDIIAAAAAAAAMASAAADSEAGSWLESPAAGMAATGTKYGDVFNDGLQHLIA